MFFRQFSNRKDLAFIMWKFHNGRIDNGHTKRYGNGWTFTKDDNKQTFKLELIT